MASFIGLLIDFCICGANLDTIRITDKKLLRFTLSKLGQVLHIDKTGFLMPSFMYI